jgi:enolase
MSAKIKRIHAREVLDSRGNPTVEVEAHCEGGAWGRAIVPSGASTGRHEAKELRDGDPQRFCGKGVRQAVGNVNNVIAGALQGRPVGEQRQIDKLLCDLDGTPDKSRLGANAILGVSLACAHAAAAAAGVPLWRHLSGNGNARMPLPMVNMISGALHAGGYLDFQDFLLIPIGAGSYSQALEMTVTVYRALGATLKSHNYEGFLVGDEGGFGPRMTSSEEAIRVLVEAIGKAGYMPGQDAAIGLDVASTHFYRDAAYHLKCGPTVGLSSEKMVAMLAQWVEKYPICSIEDGQAEDDWAGWKKLTEALGNKVQLIGDDLFTTHPDRLQRGITAGVGNSVLIKLNQVGTLTETLDVMDRARAAGYRPVVSARSGETEDTTIADLAVGTGAGQIKIGSVARSERLAKYNQLWRIEETMGPAAPFARWQDLWPDQGKMSRTGS